MDLAAELAEFRKEQEAEFAAFQEKMKKRQEEKKAAATRSVAVASKYAEKTAEKDKSNPVIVVSQVQRIGKTVARR
eukprot:SAG22_NODE_13923_length_390_cov_1.773196_1_plen_75_part_10